MSVAATECATHALASREVARVLATDASAGLAAAVVYLPVAHEPFQTVSLGVGSAAVVVSLALAPFVLVKLAKALARTRRADSEVGPLEAEAQRKARPR